MRNFILLLILILWGCIPTYKLSRPHLIYGDKKGSEPELNTQATVDSGNVIYSEFKYKINPGVALNKDLRTKYRDVQANVRLSKMDKGGQAVYGTVSISDRSVTYLKDEDDNGKFDQILVQARHNATNWTDIGPNVSYHKEKGIRSETGGFQLDIIYQGKKDSIITFCYQEYRKNLTSPSIEKKINYRLGNAKKNIFSINGAQFEVLDASSGKLHYKIIKGFE